MKFIKIKFGGGLGNQLFQYATVRAMMSKDDILLLDAGSYSNDYLNRELNIVNYKIKGQVINNSVINKFFIPGTKLNKICKLLGIFSFIQEEGFFIHDYLRKRLNFLTTIHGYWQSETYFYDIRKQLLKEIIPISIPLLPEILHNPNTVAVHVRRTDYLNDDRYGFLGEAYYINAMSIIKQRMSSPVFIFFSDDMGWCRESFSNENILFCDDPNWQTDWLQLYLMSLCKHQIIANSSFSWWGAWLNTNEEKTVVRPVKPFRDESLYYENYYPSSWVAI